jgi:hypothetical protein
VIAMNRWFHARSGAGQDGSTDSYVVHRFDTAMHDLERLGYLLELHEHTGGLFLVLASSGDTSDATGRARVQIDRSWALEILSGAISPLAPLERRIRQPWPAVLESVRAGVGGQPLHRVDSRLAESAAVNRQPEHSDTNTDLSTVRAAG